ncbi:MAG: asparagine synthase C-terminal domain-containing protein [Halobacteriales archaeon]|nr:asparagine synthase C-terminal domain-containing protein [Halobacteriales archaeon]
MAVISDEGINRKQFYSPDIKPIDQDIETAARQLRRRVEDAVEERLQADVPLGAFLSGGIDYDVITGLLAEIRDDPVNTFSVGFHESQFDETWAAREVASYHDTNHHEYKVSPSDVRDVIETVIPSLGEPFADSSILPTYIVSQKTREEMTVALSGDGADELFAGYSKYRGEFYSKYYRVLPRSVRRNVITPNVNRLPASRGTKTGNSIRKARNSLRVVAMDRAERQYQWMTLTTPQSSSAVRNIDVKAMA